MGKTLLLIVGLSVLSLLNLTSCADNSKYENLQSRFLELEAANQNLYLNYSGLNAQYADLSSAYETLYFELALARKQIQDLVDYANQLARLANTPTQSYYPSYPTPQEQQQYRILQQQEELQRLQIEELKRQEAERLQREMMEEILSQWQ